MSRGARGLRASSLPTLAIVVALLLGLASPMPAQGMDRAPLLSENARVELDGSILQISASRHQIDARLGGHTFQRVVVENLGGEGRDIAITLSAEGFGQQTAALQVPGRTTGVRFLPMPAVSANWSLQVLIDGRVRTALGYSSTNSRMNGECSLLLIGKRNEPQVRERTWLSSNTSGRTGRRTSSPTYSFTLCEPLDPSELPPHWWMLSGYDLIWIDGSDPNLGPEEQKLLANTIRGGCLVILERADRLPSGDLRSLVDRLPDRKFHQVGPGRLAVFRDAAVDAEIREFLGTARSRFLDQRPALGQPPGFLMTLKIPGLGEVPMRLFFFVLLAFAVVTGPVNYLYHKRKRRLNRLLVTVPALGLSTALLVVLIGFLFDGLGVRSVERSITWLDQQDHQSTTFQQQSVFAGIGPSELRPHPDTNVLGVDTVLMRHVYSGGYYYNQSDLGNHRHSRRSDGVLSGDLVPSRTLSNLVTTTTRPERARLQFRVDPSGGYRVLPDAELAPEDGSNQLILRSPDGRYFAQSEGSQLCRQITRSEARKLLSQLWTRFDSRTFEAADYRGRGYIQRSFQTSGPSIESATRHLGGNTQEPLERGTYVMRAKRIPWRESLGLEASQDLTCRLVVGTLGPEDIDG